MHVQLSGGTDVTNRSRKICFKALPSFMAAEIDFYLPKRYQNFIVKI